MGWRLEIALKYECGHLVSLSWALVCHPRKNEWAEKMQERNDTLTMETERTFTLQLNRMFMHSLFLCACSSVENIYIYFMEPSQTRGSELQCSLLIACTCYHALYKRADTAEVTYCWVGPCLSIYDIFLSVHSITTCYNSLKLLTEAPPPALNTLQHNSPLLKIDPCEVTHSGKHTARRTMQRKNKRRTTTLEQENAPNAPLITSYYRLLCGGPMCAAFVNDTVKFWGQLEKQCKT